MTSGIYAITNTINGRQYIGSAVNIAQRWATHRYQLSQEIHHARHLQRAWDKYGADAFTFTVLEVVIDLSLLIEREQAHMDARFAATGDIGYNSRPRAESNRGFHHTEEHRRYLSRMLSGRPKNARLTELSRATRRRNILATQTPEARAKATQTKQNRPPTEKELAYRKRLSDMTTARNRALADSPNFAAILQRAHSPEARAKAARANRMTRTAKRLAAQALVTDDTPLTCRLCGEVKAARMFSRAKYGYTGRQSYCKDCMREYKQSRYYRRALQRGDARLAGNHQRVLPGGDLVQRSVDFL